MDDHILKYNISKVLKWSLYVIFVSVVVNNNTLQEVRSVLIAAPLLFGPSLGYTAYKVIKYKKRAKADLEFRRELLLKTTVETMVILNALYIIAVLLELVQC